MTTPTAWTSRFEEALVFAARLHRGQTRKATDIPYVTHLLAVAAFVGEAGGTEDEAIAALLHDAVEDQGGQSTLDAIRARFGDTVADIVWGCSDTDVTPKPPWRARKEAYIAHLEHASPSVLLVSCADKLHNARSLVTDVRAHGPTVWDRFTGGRDGSLWNLEALAAAYDRLGAPRRLVDDLHRALEELRALS